MTIKIHTDIQLALENFQKENECSQDTAIALILRKYLYSEGYLPLVDERPTEH